MDSIVGILYGAVSNATVLDYRQKRFDFVKCCVQIISDVYDLFQGVMWLT